MPREDINEILNKYRKKVGDHIDEESEGQVISQDSDSFSKEYQTFREEVISDQASSYERWCNAAENIFHLKPQDKIINELQEAIDAAHLKINPSGAASLAALVSLLFIFGGMILCGLIFLLTEELPIFTLLMFLILGLGSLLYLNKMPIYLATKWRLKASNQMVLAILYVVIYMRHTSNLEHAIKFAAQHIDSPLSLDLRKIFWDVETGKYPTIKESLDNYLESWRHYNLEFVTAFHLIESSLYEPTQSRRSDLLDKALNVILEGTYEKMLHYAQDVKGPITTLHMLGVILPILGLVVFPLVGSFLQGLVKWYHLAFLYNIILPVMVFSLGMNILSKRPTGYGQSKVAERVYQKGFDPFWLCFFIATLLIVIGFLPIMFKWVTPPTFLENQKCAVGDIDLGDSLGCFFGYFEFGGKAFGPFGIGALILSFFIPAGVAIGFGYYNKLKSKKVIELRNETKTLESEFASTLFQLGNRIGDGIPTELAFNKVAHTMEGTPPGNFFSLVDATLI